MSQIIKPGSGGGGGGATLVNDNTTVQWQQSGSTYTQDFGLSNLLLGSSGSSITTANDNVGLGEGSLSSITDNQDCVAIGLNAMGGASTGFSQIAIGTQALEPDPSGPGASHDNVAIGFQSTFSLTTGAGNIAVGSGTLGNLSSGDTCIAIGDSALENLTSNPINGDPTSIGIGGFSLSNITTGSDNIAIGYNSGKELLTTESHNIYIGNIGVVADNNTLRIGGSAGVDPGNIDLSAAFIDGIAGVTTSNSQMVTINTATGQLGSAAIPGGGTVSSMLAYKSSGTANATGDGTTATVVFDTVTYDQHSDYNNTNGAFTVPVTGTYMVSGMVSIQNLGTTTEWTVFVQSTLYTMFCISNNAVNVGNTGLIWLPFSALVRLPAADFIEIQVQGAGGTKNNTIFGAGGYFTWLTIALVNPG